jgi:hypothetical protein
MRWTSSTLINNTIIVLANRELASHPATAATTEHRNHPISTNVGRWPYQHPNGALPPKPNATYLKVYAGLMSLQPSLAETVLALTSPGRSSSQVLVVQHGYEDQNPVYLGPSAWIPTNTRADTFLSTLDVSCQWLLLQSGFDVDGRQCTERFH